MCSSCEQHRRCTTAASEGAKRGSQEREGAGEGEAVERWQCRSSSIGRGEWVRHWEKWEQRSDGSGRGSSVGLGVVVRGGRPWWHSPTCMTACWPHHQRASVGTRSPRRTALLSSRACSSIEAITCLVNPPARIKGVHVSAADVVNCRTRASSGAALKSRARFGTNNRRCTSHTCL